MEKHTKEYAEKLAKSIYQKEPSSISEFAKDLAEPKRKSFANGYMKAIEETNVAELLEALKALRKWAISKGIDIEGKLIINADNAIKKATE